MPATDRLPAPLSTRNLNRPQYASDLEPYFYKSGHAIRRLFGEEEFLEPKKTVNPLKAPAASSKEEIYAMGAHRRRLSKKPKLIRAPYRKRDGDLHPLVFPGWDMLVNENTMPVGPKFQFQAIIKDKWYDSGNFIIVPLAVRRVFSKDLTMSIYGTSLSASSKLNQLNLVKDVKNLCELQLEAVHSTLSYVKEIYPDLREAGCHRLLVALMPEMNWVVQSMIKWTNMPSNFHKLERPEQMNKFKYISAIEQLVSLVGHVERRSRLKIQFWPTSGEDLNGLTERAEQILASIPGVQQSFYKQIRPEEYALRFRSAPPSAPLLETSDRHNKSTGSTPRGSEECKENVIWQTLDSNPGPTGCELARAMGPRPALGAHSPPAPPKHSRVGVLSGALGPIESNNIGITSTSPETSPDRRNTRTDVPPPSLSSTGTLGVSSSSSSTNN